MQIYITDRTGQKFFRTNVNAGFANGERNNLARHLENAKRGVFGYSFIDAATARLAEERDKWDDTPEIGDDDLLTELGSN